LPSVIQGIAALFFADLAVAQNAKSGKAVVFYWFNAGTDDRA